MKENVIHCPAPPRSRKGKTAGATQPAASWAWLALMAAALLLTSCTGPAAPAAGEGEQQMEAATPTQKEAATAAPTDAPAATATDAPQPPLPTQTSSPAELGWQQASADGFSLWLPEDFRVATAVGDLHELTRPFRDNGDAFYADYVEGTGNFEGSDAMISWRFETRGMKLYAVSLSDISWYDYLMISRYSIHDLEIVQYSQSSGASFEEIDFQMPGRQTYAAKLGFQGPESWIYQYLIVQGDALWEVAIYTDFVGWDFTEEDVNRIVYSLEFN